MPYSVIIEVPRTIAPAARRRATAVASSPHGEGSTKHVPERRGRPRTPVCSLTTTGTPSSGPRAFFSRWRTVESSASRSASSSQPSRRGPTEGSRAASARAPERARATISDGVTRPAEYATARVSLVTGHAPRAGSACVAPSPRLGGRACNGRASSGGPPRRASERRARASMPRSARRRRKTAHAPSGVRATRASVRRETPEMRRARAMAARLPGSPAEAAAQWTPARPA